MAEAVKEEKKKGESDIMDDNWILSDEYKSIFPANNPEWINKPLIGLPDNDKKYDPSLIDKFVPPDANKPHKYYSLIEEALNTFKKWNKWGVGKDEWVLKVEHKEINHKGYIHEFPDSDIPATKEVHIYPYNIAVLGGFLGNTDFVFEYDPTLTKAETVETLNWYTTISYSQIKLGIPFVSDRDFLTVDAAYGVNKCEMLIISTSLTDKNYKHKNYKPDKKFVRGSIILSVTHLRPYYEKDLNQTVLTEYAYLKMNGSLPGWIVKTIAAAETHKYVREWMDANKKKWNQPGKLYIPLELLQFVDLETLPKLFEKYKDILTEDETNK